MRRSALWDIRAYRTARRHSFKRDRCNKEMTTDNVIATFAVDGRSSYNLQSGQSPWRVEALIRVADGIIAAHPQLFADAGDGSNKRLNVRLIRDYAVRGFIPRPVRIGRMSHFGLKHLVQLLAVRALLSLQKWSLRVIKANLTVTSQEDLLDGLLSPVKARVHAEYAQAAGLVRKPTRPSSEVRPAPGMESPLFILRETPDASEQLVPGEVLIANSGLTTVPKLESSAPPELPTAATSKLHIALEPWCEVVIDTHRSRLLTWEEVDRLTKTLQDRLRAHTPQVRRTRPMSNNHLN